jgi:hypothetical protein
MPSNNYYRIMVYYLIMLRYTLMNMIMMKIGDKIGNSGKIRIKIRGIFPSASQTMKTLLGNWRRKEYN